MLVEQAALAFQLWTGHDIPRSIMFDAINMDWSLITFSKNYFGRIYVTFSHCR